MRSGDPVIGRSGDRNVMIVVVALRVHTQTEIPE